MMSFVVGFILLVAALFAFGIVAENGNIRAADAEFSDIANRVANSVLELFTVGATFQETFGTTDSGVEDDLRYTKTLDIPVEFRGYEYTIAMRHSFVYVNSTGGEVQVRATTFKADVLLPSGSEVCDLNDHTICVLGGDVPAGSSRVTVTYQYRAPEVATPTEPEIHSITIS